MVPVGMPSRTLGVPLRCRARATRSVGDGISTQSVGTGHEVGVMTKSDGPSAFTAPGPLRPPCSLLPPCLLYSLACFVSLARFIPFRACFLFHTQTAQTLGHSDA